MAEPGEKKWLTTKEACAYLSVSPVTLWRMRRRKTVRASKDAGVVRYSREGLDRAMEERREGK